MPDEVNGMLSMINKNQYSTRDESDVDNVAFAHYQQNVKRKYGQAILCCPEVDDNYPGSPFVPAFSDSKSKSICQVITEKIAKANTKSDGTDGLGWQECISEGRCSGANVAAGKTKVESSDSPEKAIKETDYAGKFFDAAGTCTNFFVDG